VLEDFVYQVFLGTEVVIDRGNVDIRPGCHLSQRGSGKPVLREKVLSGMQDAFFRIEMVGHVFPEIELNDCFNRMLVRVVGQVYAVDA
jgi:hypothetical protein